MMGKREWWEIVLVMLAGIGVWHVVERLLQWANGIAYYFDHAAALAGPRP